MRAILNAKAPFINGSFYIFLLIFLLPCILFESGRAGSAFHPLNNATKLSYVKHDVVGGTNKKDVKGLTALQDRFPLIPKCGDPCLDPFMPCTYVTCNEDPSPRVTELNLASNYLLQGRLPDFSSMDALKIIDFSNNPFLTGPVPSFLAKFPNLTTLKLSYCDFTGTLPKALSSNRAISIEAAGNPRLTIEDSPSDTPATTTTPPSNTPTPTEPATTPPTSITPTTPASNTPPTTTPATTTPTTTQASTTPPTPVQPPSGDSSSNQLQKILGGSLSSVAVVVVAVVIRVILRRRKSVTAATAYAAAGV